MDRNENTLSGAPAPRNDNAAAPPGSTSPKDTPLSHGPAGPSGAPADSESPPPIGSAAWLAWRTREREAALAAAIARNRAAAPLTASLAPRTAASIAAASIAANGATSIRDIERTRPASSALPLHVQTFTGARVCHPKVWEADLKPTGIRPDFDRWLGSSRIHARARVPGDVLAPTIVRVAELIVWEARKRATGFARITALQLARLAGCCERTAQKAIRFLERSRLLDTFNVISRDGKTGEHRRGANLYFLAAPAGPASGPAWSDPPPPASVTIPDMIADRLRRYAHALALQARGWGLNTAPDSPSPRRRRPPD